ncbi:IS630 family transposase [Deferrisoma camini]|uniref:IS630 family transposase n=1 Tax=Deferrisoma camini TaxID=1035120 RepID=UPI00046CE412|nr:IS630 family transposase [Deferrisoma camini]
MKCKRRTDNRSLDKKAQEALRIRVVRQVREGVSPEQLAKTLDINPRTIYRWIERFHYGGEEALRNKPKTGRPPKLTAAQMAWIAHTVRDKNPQQMSFPFALWTLGMIRELIRWKFGVRLSEVSVGRVMRALGFTPQRPLHRAYQQNPALVEKWREEEYPKIRKRARKENALIFFADESGIRSDYHKGHTWAEAGRTPVVKATGKRFSVNMLSAVSPRGEFRFMVHEGTVTAEVFCTFLRRLAAGVEQKIFLIVDRHAIHRAKRVRELLEEMDGKITLFFLPPYSPELNPDELVWSQVKRRVARELMQSKEDLKARVLSALRSLQRMPDKIRGFFLAPSCRYAA